MRKPIPLSERRVMVSIKYGLIEALHNISDDISTAIESLLNEINKKDAKIFERDKVIEKLANGIEILNNLLNKESVSESDIVSAQNELKDLQLVLQQHLEYLNQNAKR